MQDVSANGLTASYETKGDDMKSFEKIAKSFVADESGQDLIEYALVAAVISLGAVASLQPLAAEVSSLFSSVTTTLSSAV
jgi:pilus assembly protein Flp/PilA